MNRHIWSPLVMWEEWMVNVTIPPPIRPHPFRDALKAADHAELEREMPVLRARALERFRRDDGA